MVHTSLQEEATGSRRGRRPAGGIPRAPRGRGRKAAAQAALSEGAAAGGGGATVTQDSGGGRSRRSRRVAARSGRSGGDGDSVLTGSGWTGDEDWSEADEEDEEAGGGEVRGAGCTVVGVQARGACPPHWWRGLRVLRHLMMDCVVGRPLS